MNDKQRQFAEYYAACGNATQAAELAGYSPDTARAQGSRMLTNVDILQYVRELQNAAAENRVANLVEIKAFWTSVLNDESQPIRDRLKASELLAKSAGAFAKKPDEGQQDPFGIVWEL